jgi:tetratricopeptide (TPR) repeat protein
LVPAFFGIDIYLILPFLEKLSSAIIVSLSAVILFLIVQRLTDLKIALIITIIFALGTSNWSVASQNLWQHGPGELFVLLAIYMLLKGNINKQWVSWSGLFLSSAFAMRPLHAIAVVIFGFYVLIKYRKDKSLIIFYSILSIIPVSFVFIYNFFYFNNFFIGGYEFIFPEKFPVKPFLGLLFSPSRGLFSYSPILLFCIPGMFIAWRKRYSSLYLCFFIIPVLYLIVYSMWHNWWGGWSFGPRLQIDTLPFLMMFFIPLFSQISTSSHRIPLGKPFLKKLFTGIFTFALLVSMGMQFIGAFAYSNFWNDKADIDLFPERLYYWYDSQMYFYLNILNPFDKSFKNAIVSINSSDYTQGINYLKEVIINNKKNIIARYILANILQNNGEYAGSEYHYKEILRFYPGYKPALHQLVQLDKNMKLLKNIKENSLPRDAWTTSSNYNSEETLKALDNKLDTRWTSKTPQVPGMHFTIDFGDIIQIQRILLNFGSSVGDCPKKLSIEIYDEENQKQNIFSSEYTKCNKNYIDIHFHQQYSVKKMTLLQRGENQLNWWSIHEIYIQ